MALLLALPAAVAAQQRPLQTHVPEGIGAGRVRVDVGLEVLPDVWFPASGLGGDLLRSPVVGVAIGLGSIADLQVDASLFERLAIDERRDAPLADRLQVQGGGSAGVGRVVVATKVRILGESGRRPAIGLRLETRLPTASAEDGLALDTTDFGLTLLGAKQAGPYRVVANLGLGILANPVHGDSQNDVVLYGGAIQRMTSADLALVAEAHGRLNLRRSHVPTGTESAGQARVGIRHRAWGGMVDVAVLAGLTSRDAPFGVTAGYTRVFDAFKLP